MGSVQRYWMRLVGVFVVLANAPFANASEGFWGTLYGEVVQDYKSFYTTSTLQSLTPGLLVAGVMANTNIDEYLHEEIPHEDEDFAYDSKQINYFGDSTRTIPSIPVYLGIMGIDHWLNDQESIYGKWGRYSFRTFMVGAPSGFLAANVLGGSRPTEGRGSDWRLFDDVNSISGHSFSGAVPMVNAAMLAESIEMKSLFYTLSVMPGLARVAIDKHFTESMPWTASLKPSHLFLASQEPEALSLSELHRYQAYLKGQELNAGLYQLEFWTKALMPMACFALVIVALSNVFGPLRSSTMGGRIFSGVLIGIIFQNGLNLFGKMSLALSFSPLIGVSIPIALCFAIGILLMRRKG